MLGGYHLGDDHHPCYPTSSRQQPMALTEAWTTRQPASNHGRSGDTADTSGHHHRAVAPQQRCQPQQFKPPVVEAVDRLGPAALGDPGAGGKHAAALGGVGGRAAGTRAGRRVGGPDLDLVLARLSLTLQHEPAHTQARAVRALTYLRKGEWPGSVAASGTPSCAWGVGGAGRGRQVPSVARPAGSHGGLAVPRGWAAIA